MRQCRNGAWLAMLLTGMTHSALPAGPELQLLAPPVSGLIWMQQDGQAAGPAIDLMREMVARAGLRARFSLVPWARAIETAARQPGSCVLGLARSPANLDRYRWAGPILRQRKVLWARPDEMRSLQSLAGVGATRLGAVRGTLIAQDLAAQGQTLDLSPDEASGLRKLMAGHIDLLASHERTMRDLLASLPPPHPRVALVLKPAHIGYVACHRTTSPTVVRRLDQAISALRREGRFRSLGR